MKKFAIFTLVLALAASMLVGCGCMNTGDDVPTLPTNGETSTPTRPTTAPTTMPTTAPTTEATTEAATDTTGIMDDIMGGSTDDATTGNGGSIGGDGGSIGGDGGSIGGDGGSNDGNTGNGAKGRSGGMDMGRGRTHGNGPRG